LKEKSYSCLAIEEVVNVGKWISRTIYLLKDVVVPAFGIVAFLAVSIECLAGVGGYDVYPII
jgi:hypothetical protein